MAIVPVIDCGRQSVLAPVERALRKTFGSAQGVPEGLKLRTDHGPQHASSDTRELTDRWGVDHTSAPVGRPTGNAVAKGVIRTMKDEVVWLRDWDSLEELRAALKHWLGRYNTERPHQALDWQTPAARRAGRLAPHPNPVA